MPSLNGLISKFKEKGLSINKNGKVYCSFCNKEVSISHRGKNDVNLLKQHVKDAKHFKLEGAKKKQNVIPNAFQNQEKKMTKQQEFNFDLAQWLIEINMPLSKLEHPSTKKFIEKWTNQTCPDRSNISKRYLEPLYDQRIEQIRNLIKDHDVNFQIDETTDPLNRFVINILVAPLNGEYHKPMLFYMNFIEATNSGTVKREIINACSKLWPQGIPYDKIIIVTTDQAPYMIKAFNDLKDIFKDLKHVTCLAHALHRVAELFRENHPLVGVPAKILMEKIFEKDCLKSIN